MSVNQLYVIKPEQIPSDIMSYIDIVYTVIYEYINASHSLNRLLKKKY